MTDSTLTEKFALYNGDCVEALRGMPDNSVHYSIFSPPFASLFTYSNSPRDMGNVRDDEEFFEHFAFLVDELYRVLKPGRLLSFHCMDIPSSKVMHGYTGIRDFRGELIRAFTRPDKKRHPTLFINHSTVCIWKCPVIAMQRTKSIGLLYKQLRKDSAMSRQGIADYLVTVRKPDPNEEPIEKTHEGFPVALWQRYASPVWATIAEPLPDGFYDISPKHDPDNDSSSINPSDTLQYRSAREHDDERHICPLQLQVIERAIRLWTNPGDTVLSPFAGIGSEGYVALQEGRKFVGAELKRSYYEQAVRNLLAAEVPAHRGLFDGAAE